MSANHIGEPEIITQHREQLAYLLTEAAEIEHGLMCCYLFAAYSLNVKRSEAFPAEEIAAIVRWRSTISSIAVEEMVHLALVNNLLISIGFAPQFVRPNCPIAPGYHPSGIVVSLARFELATLEHFIFLERPEGVDIPDGPGFEPPPPCACATCSDRLMPSSEDYGTAGHFYRASVQVLSVLPRGSVKKGSFHRRSVPRWDVVALPGLLAITDLSSALAAIDTIVGKEKEPKQYDCLSQDDWKSETAPRPTTFKDGWPPDTQARVLGNWTAYGYAASLDT